MKPVHDYYAIAETLRGACLRSVNPAVVEQRMTSFLDGYSRMFKALPMKVLVRARKCVGHERFANINAVLYPPAELVGYGRAQPPGVPMLYAGDRAIVAVDETHVQEGDWVHVAYVRPQRDCVFPCHVVGAVQAYYASQSVHPLFKLNEILEHVVNLVNSGGANAFLSSVFIDSFISEIFRRPSSAPHEYKLSAAYATLAMPPNGGLAYPSVQNQGGINYAIPAPVFDAEFEVTHTSILLVEECLGFGIYKFRRLSSSCDIKPDGTIDWQSNQRRELMMQDEPEFARAESEYRAGWRKPARE